MLTGRNEIAGSFKYLGEGGNLPRKRARKKEKHSWYNSAKGNTSSSSVGAETEENVNAFISGLRALFIFIPPK